MVSRSRRFRKRRSRRVERGTWRGKDGFVGADASDEVAWLEMVEYSRRDATAVGVRVRYGDEGMLGDIEARLKTLCGCCDVYAKLLDRCAGTSRATALSRRFSARPLAASRPDRRARDMLPGLTER
jgi:hypothetical protein